MRQVWVIALVAFPSSLRAAHDWELVVDEGDVRVWERVEPGTSLLSFRGVGSVDAPIGKLVSISMTPSRYPEWTELLSEMEVVERAGAYELVVWEHYDNMWPVSDRDFVYLTVGQADEATRSFTIRYGSMVRADSPARDCCVRGEIINTYLKFTALQDGTTQVETEVLIDPKGWIPNWVVNLVQQEWPVQMLEGLRRQAAKDDVLPDPRFANYHDGSLAHVNPK